MTASEGNLLQFLGPMAHFSIPVYQRTYTWSRAQCEQLWKDVLLSAERGFEYRHFVGAVVYIEQRDTVHGSATPEFLVIDGQQRLTTVSLLLAALCEKLSEERRKETRDQYLVNGVTQDSKRRRKLILTQRDRDTLFRIAAGDALPPDPSPTLVSNFEFFRERLAEPSVDARVVLRGLERLQFVNVKLKQGEDDPQLIFESLNATGVKLSQSDLVRNTLLMSLPAHEQTAVYEQAWHPLERLMLTDADPDRFDNMLRDFLGGERGALVAQRALHTEVRKRLQEGASRAEFARELYAFGRAWHTVAIDASTEMRELRTALERVRAVNASVAYPFLARLLDRLRAQGGDITELVAAAHWTEAYVMRRLLVQIATNTMNKTFIAFAKDCPTTGVGAWLAARTARLGWTQRFPTDEEIMGALETRDVYSMKGRNTLLERLENHGQNEPIRAANYTLEHVMPQTLTDAWRTELGPDAEGVHARRLHTLGNLTLTGYNSELSNHSFAQKKTMKGGFADSPVRLSHVMKEVERWDEEAILRRGVELGRVALAIWPRPATASAVAPTPMEGAETTRRREFWTELLAASAEVTPLFATRNPTDQVHVSVPAGIPGMWFQYWVQAYGSRVNLRIDTGDGEENLRLYRRLMESRREIEEDFGATLNWRELSEHRSCGIDWRSDVGSESDPDDVAATIPELAARMGALEAAFAGPLAKLRETS